ncbi:hypothetical protein FACS1894201_03400 [Bacteroidia bacterium]|nr:hypothetical protein FACS1894201_03400 [Bacteroidia bacterium]
MVRIANYLAPFNNLEFYNTNYTSDGLPHKNSDTAPSGRDVASDVLAGTGDAIAGGQSFDLDGSL